MRKQVSSRADSDGVEMELYQIVRYEDGAPAGGSIGSVTEWDITVRNEEGTEVTSMADAAQVSFSVGAVVPVEVARLDGFAIDESRWDATFHPRLLRDSNL
ncbi:MAG: hypothetical protein HKN13_10710 [Rhodothermales bacterium]|nr:hypothetical protein [Rhodothermales bacterium]